MLRSLCYSVPALALLLGGTVLGQDRKETSPPPPRSNATPPPGFNADRFFQQYDRNRDGYLERDELPEPLREHFSQLDTNRDGRISREELARGMASIMPRRRPSDMIFVLIEMSDCEDGCTEEVQRAYDILRRLDKNKNGKIDPGELKAERERLIKARVDALFKDLDTDGDGKISREEARGQLRADFDRIDRNHDGFIDRDELMRAAEQRPPQPPRPGAAPPPERR
jgi:Ca2+-binding EF-hand superfamily protein